MKPTNTNGCSRAYLHLRMEVKAAPSGWNLLSQSFRSPTKMGEIQMDPIRTSPSTPLTAGAGVAFLIINIKSGGILTPGFIY